MLAVSSWLCVQCTAALFSAQPSTRHRPTEPHKCPETVHSGRSLGHAVALCRTSPSSRDVACSDICADTASRRVLWSRHLARELSRAAFGRGRLPSAAIKSRKRSLPTFAFPACILHRPAAPLVLATLLPGPCALSLAPGRALSPRSMTRSRPTRQARKANRGNEPLADATRRLDDTFLDRHNASAAAGTEWAT
jgi:hypothetical protein